MLAPEPEFQWMNPPTRHNVATGSIAFTNETNTDFWRETFYGYTRQNGHFYSTERIGDFTAEVVVDGRFQSEYDQGGLMIWFDETNWVKTGVEYFEGKMFLLVVRTAGLSDWSAAPFSDVVKPFRIRLTRYAASLIIQSWNAAEEKWALLRLLPVPSTPAARVGVMSCAPRGDGFEIEFRDLRVGPPELDRLHD